MVNDQPVEPITKKSILNILEQMAVLLELVGANSFKVRAFSNGARALDQYEGNILEAATAGKLTKIKGIGKGLAQVVSDLVVEGVSSEYEELRAQVPQSLMEILKIPGLGAKKIRVLRKELGIESLDALEAAAKANKIQQLKGFGEKSETEILAGLERTRKYAERFLLPVAQAIAHRYRDSLLLLDGVEQIEIAGSLRRRRESIGDIDLLVACTDPQMVCSAFLAQDGIAAIEAEGEKKCRIITEEGIGVDLRVIDPRSFGAALHYFTGSKEHNTHMRQLAKDKGWKLNEYALWDADGQALPSSSEQQIFSALGMSYVEPELREDRGEIELGLQNALPSLVSYHDLQGTLHCHTTASDGKHSLREMAEAARAKGWSYLGIADHSQTAAYAGGLTVDRLKQQHDEILALNEEYDDFKILHGTESDILSDGNLDFPDEVLQMLDYVVVSVHSNFSQSREQQTARIEKALRHPATSVWGHPTGRLILKREGYEIDMEHLLEVAAECGVIVELNANPHRLDLDWRWGNKVRALGLLCGIHPDAHTMAGLDHVHFGIGLARKAGLSASNISNTQSLQDLQKIL